MRQALAFVLISASMASCAGDPVAAAGLECDPMAYQLDNEVWVTTGGSALRLSEGDVLGVNPDISPDGDYVVYATGPDEASLDLVVADVDGSDSRVLWAGDTSQSTASRSPDGGSLAIGQISPDGTLQVSVVESGGSASPTQLTDGEPNGKPTWTSDGQDILFLSLWDGDAQEIYRMGRDGMSPTNLTNHPSRDVLAEMSPDGSSIVFASDRSGNGDFDIWLMNADGSNPQQLTMVPERDTNPTWTTDGQHIIYFSDREPVGLWVMHADGTDQQPLLEGAWLASCP